MACVHKHLFSFLVLLLMGGQSTDANKQDVSVLLGEVYTDQHVKVLALISQHQCVIIPVSGCGAASVGAHGYNVAFPAVHGETMTSSYNI